MAKNRNNKENTTPSGVVEDTGVMLDPVVEPLVDTEVPDVVVPESIVTIIDADDKDKVSSVVELMDRAIIDPNVDTTISTETVVTDLEVPVSTNVEDISVIIKRDDIKLLEKVELIATALGGLSGSVISSLLSLYVLGSKTSTRQPDPMNREQRALVRYFIRLATQSTTEEFNQAMKYINWVYKQLTDEKLLDKESLILVRGVSPLDPTNSSIFTAGKDDNELITFVYLITVIDVKANALTLADRERKIDISKTTTNTLLTEDIINKINNFYIA